MTEAEALLLLQEDATKGTRGPRTDPTEPRIAAVWFKLVNSVPHLCENPNCQDPRPEGDKGRKVTVVVKGQHICRYCFISGYLSTETRET